MIVFGETQATYDVTDSEVDQSPRVIPDRPLPPPHPHSRRSHHASGSAASCTARSRTRVGRHASRSVDCAILVRLLGAGDRSPVSCAPAGEEANIARAKRRGRWEVVRCQLCGPVRTCRRTSSTSRTCRTSCTSSDRFARVSRTCVDPRCQGGGDVSTHAGAACYMRVLVWVLVLVTVGIRPPPWSLAGILLLSPHVMTRPQVWIRLSPG